MTALAANYRVFDLPWAIAPEEERRFRRMLAVALVMFVIAGLIVPLLPLPARPPAPALPEEVVDLVLAPPPVPKAPPEVKKPPPPELPVKPAERERPVPNRQEDARRKANQAGLLAMKDELEDLRETLDTSALEPTANLKANVVGPSRAERSLITSEVATSSGGINTSSLSRAYGSGPGSLRGQIATQKVASFADALAKGREASRSGKSGKASRSREEIEMVFDRNKAAIYALYNRALRDRPELQGKVVIELTIAPSGDVTACRIVSSELDDAELERKLVARIRLFRFEAKDVETITTTKPIEFFPA